MKLAVKKEEGRVPGGGFHYMTHPMAMHDDFEAECYARMGYVIIEVSQEVGEKLIKGAGAALGHQMEVAYHADKAEKEGKQQ